MDGREAMCDRVIYPEKQHHDGERKGREINSHSGGVLQHLLGDLDWESFNVGHCVDGVNPCDESYQGI